ncbi:MAG: hypothetical protein JW724_02750 [Candidatus Altiarchaeota archaeon]|nr:hypothetical protein [Candidatus Altiarchaeota archaeon]
MMKKIASLLLPVLFFAAAAAAEGGGGSGLDEFLKSMADTIGKSVTGSINREIYAFMVSGRLNELADAAGENIPGLLRKELPLEEGSFRSLSNLFISLLQPFYVMALLSVGLYMIFFSGSPGGRAKAKFLFMVLLAGMVAVSLSTDIVRLLLQVSNTLTLEVLSRNPGDYVAAQKASADYFTSYMQKLMVLDVSAGIPFMIPALLSAAGVFTILLLRYMLLLLFTILFPAAIFLSFFYPTRRLGRIMVKQLLFWIFLPVGYAVSFVVVSVSGDAFISFDPDFTGIACVSGTFFTLLFPVFFFVSVNWFTETVMQLEVLTQPIQSFAGLPERARSPDAAEVVHRKKKPVKKPSEDGGPALGLRGYRRVGLKEAGIRAEDERKPYTPIASVRPGGLYGYGGGDLPEHEMGYGAKAGEGTSKDGGMYAHAASGISPEVRRRSALVAIPPQGMPFLEIELSEGETETVTIIVRNDTGRYMDKVMAFDDELEDAGLAVSYSTNSFTLAPGEERLVKVSITAPKSFRKKFHGGSLVFKGGRDLRSIVDVNIKAQSRKPLSGGQAVSAGDDSTILSLFGTTRASLPKGMPGRHMTKGFIPEKEEAIHKASETAEKEPPQPKPRAGEAKEEKPAKAPGRRLERPGKTVLVEEPEEKAGMESGFVAAGTKSGRRFIEKAAQETQVPVRVTDSPEMMRYLMSLPRMHEGARLLKRPRRKGR